MTIDHSTPLALQVHEAPQSNESYFNFSDNGKLISYGGELPDLLKANSRQVLITKISTLAIGTLFLLSLFPFFQPGAHLSIEYFLSGSLMVLAMSSLRKAVIAHSTQKKCIDKLSEDIATDLQLKEVDISAIEYNWEDFKQEIQKNIFFKV